MNTYNLSSQNSITQNSSGGKLLKWKVGNKYIKTSTIDTTSLTPRFMYESYGEVIVYKLAKRLGFNCVEYKLCKVIIDNQVETIACESNDFKQLGYIDYSIGKLMLLGKIPKLFYGEYDSYNILLNTLKFIPEFRRYLDTLILLDSITLNDDRHFGNFGLLINRQCEMKVQPIFDNGNSLFCHKHIDGMNYDEKLIQYLVCKPFNRSFNEQLKLIDKSIIEKDKLKESIPYIHGVIDRLREKGLPDTRAKFTKDLLKDRITTIISMEI